MRPANAGIYLEDSAQHLLKETTRCDSHLGVIHIDILQRILCHLYTGFAYISLDNTKSSDQRERKSSLGEM
jgi:hypothetical protein